MSNVIDRSIRSNRNLDRCKMSQSKLRSFTNYSRSALNKRRKIQVDNDKYIENSDSDLSDADNNRELSDVEVSELEDIAFTSASEKSDSSSDEDATSNLEQQRSTNKAGSDSELTNSAHDFASDHSSFQDYLGYFKFFYFYRN